MSDNSTWRRTLHPKGQREWALTEQLDAPSEAIDVHEGPERVSRADPIEEEHGSRVVDAVEHAPLLVHPEGDDVALIGELFWQGLGPEAALGHQVRAGVLGQRAGVDAGRVLAREAQPQRPAPAALLRGDLGGRGWASETAPSPARPPPTPGREPVGTGVCPLCRPPTGRLSRAARSSPSPGLGPPGHPSPTPRLSHREAEKGARKRDKEDEEGREEREWQRKEKGQGVVMARMRKPEAGAQRKGAGGRPHLQPDLLIEEDRAVTEGDGVAEAGLPLDGLVAEVHEDLGALGVRVEEQRRSRETPAGAALRTVLLLVVASVRGDREGAPNGVCKGTSHSVRECASPRAGPGAPREGQGWGIREVAHRPIFPPSRQPATTATVCHHPSPATIYCHFPLHHHHHLSTTIHHHASLVTSHHHHMTIC